MSYHLLVLVLNKTECLEELLEALYEQGHTGATILDSRGMAQSLSDHEDLPFLASLRLLLDPDHRENKTVFMVVEPSRIAEISAIVNRVTGGLDRPDTGILFTIPVQSVEGLGGTQ